MADFKSINTLESIGERLEEQRRRLFAVQGVLQVTCNAIDDEDDEGSDPALQSMRWALMSAVDQLGSIAKCLERPAICGKEAVHG